jgi:polyhydroxyalkanoate synthesis regulator protein
MKTAMQELIEQLEKKHGDILFQFPNLLSNIDEFLEKEKQQIINSYAEGRISVITKEIISYQEYYDSTFGDNPEAGI